jgi:hypothetical protein
VFGEALALAVRLTADQDPGQAARELVAGLVDGFDPGLYALAQELIPGTVDILAGELGNLETRETPGAT